MAGFQINEPAVSDVIRALVHVLGHEADVRVSRAASTHHYGFSLPDVLRQRIDALLCEGQVEASGQGIAQSDRKVEINMPRITGEVRVSGSTAESCSNFGSLIADTPVCKRVRICPPPGQNMAIGDVVSGVCRTASVLFCGS